ncbi:MAG TPA: zinc-binding alcohol dehydrogenase family protein [Solirubrobacteraceae bacterium]|nr:zinc-binding alcohol dehydrogenase family protein [Solirubrobacteraceae bacterium]
MRAALIEQPGQAPRVGDVAEPEPAEGLLSAAISAAALNPIDLRIANGGWAGRTPRTPYVPGCEGVGRLSDGRRVWFMAPGNYGSFAERCAIDPARAVELPEGLDDAVAACLGVAGLAAWLSLRRRAHLREGETVLVLGASGPVGTFAVQLAKLMGAARVVAAARSAEGLRRATELGADATVNIAEVEDLTGAFREATGGGADVTIDPLWGAPAAAAVAAAARGARHVQMGQSAGAEASLTSAVVRGNGLSILGFTNFEVPAPEQAAAYRELAEHALAGRLRIDYDTYPLERVGEAWKRQQEGAHRKLVITF